MSYADEYGRLKALIESDPQRAQALLREIQKKTIVPHAGGQQAVLDDETRFKILCAGRRWGKTKIGAKVLINEARRRQKQMVWWVAPTYRIVKRGYREVLAQLPRELLTHVPPQDSAFDAGRSVALRLKNGSRIEFYSAERPEGMLGEGVDFAVVDEAALIAKNVWDQTIRPTLMDRQGGALMISTPRGHNWFYDVWLRGQNVDEPDWVSWVFPSWTNPTLPEGELEDMKRTYPAVLYEQEVEAKFTSDSASVFRFNETSVKQRVTPQKQHVYLGVDLAKSKDFTVLTAARERDRMPVYHDRFNAISWPEQKRRITKAVQTILKSGASAVTLVIDSTGLGDPIVDDLEEQGLDVIGIKFTNAWKNQAVMLLGSDLETAQAFLTEEQINEFRAYAYVHKLDTGRITYSAPDGQHDDEVSAKLLEHWGMVHEGSPDIKSLESAGVGVTPGDLTADNQDEFQEAYEAMLDLYGESDVEDGAISYDRLVPRSTTDLMNDPSCWF